MSISLEEARKKLDILEKLSNEPELILTSLFPECVSGASFLFQVNVGGKNIMDYLKEYLISTHPFEDCEIRNGSNMFYFYLPSLKTGKYSNYIGDDLIAEIDVKNRTYNLFAECISEYKDVMSEEYKLDTVELSNWWKRFTDLGIKNRLNQIREVIHSDKRLFVKISDIYFWTVMTNKRRRKLRELFEKEIKK